MRRQRAQPPPADASGRKRALLPVSPRRARPAAAGAATPIPKRAKSNADADALPARKSPQPAAAAAAAADSPHRRSTRIRHRNVLPATPTVVAADAIANDPQLICRVAQVSGVVPRKRFDIDVLRAAVVLRGKSVSYRVPCAAISRLIILPIPRCGVVDVAVELHASCEGVRGHHLVLRAPANLQVEWLQPQAQPQSQAQVQPQAPHADDEVVDVDAYANAEEDSDSHSDDDAEPARLLADALASAGGAAVVPPGCFRSSLGHHAVGCTLSVEQGHLFLLDDAALFVHHPVLAVRYADVVGVRCAAVSGLRMIQLVMRLADGDVVVFDHVDKSEHEFINKFLVARGLRFEADDDDASDEEGDTGATQDLQADLPDVDDSSDYCPSE